METPAQKPNFDWDAHWNEYDLTAQANPGQVMRHDLVARILGEQSAQEMRLLDIGSGQGDMLVRLHKALPTASLVGFELSASGVCISKLKLPGADFLEANLYKPGPDMDRYRNWATHAVCCEVLEHVEDPSAFLRSASAYLAPGAFLIVTVPSGPMSAFDKYIGHLRHFSQESLGTVTREGGFETIRFLRAGFPFFNLYRLTVIARGKKLIEDARSTGSMSPSRLALSVMALYQKLFRFNLESHSFGWQLVVCCRKPE